MSEKSKSTAFLLCYFLGVLGVHRFYLGRWKTAVLMLLTGGGLLIWWMIDVVLIMGAKLNDAEGEPLRTGPGDADNPHAGFWVRLAAMSVDMLIVQLVVIALSFVGSIALGLGTLATTNLEDPEAIEQMVAGLSALTGLLLLVSVPLYFGLQTASSHQATVGKRVFDIYVSSNADGKLNLIRSLWRAVCYMLSALPLGLGFVLAGLTNNKRALHDYLAGSKVMYAEQDAITASAALRAVTTSAVATQPAASLRRTRRRWWRQDHDCARRSVTRWRCRVRAALACMDFDRFNTPGCTQPRLLPTIVGTSAIHGGRLQGTRAEGPAGQLFSKLTTLHAACRTSHRCAIPR